MTDDNHAAGGGIDVHAHYLPPFYAAALREREMWMIGGLPVPEWSPELALEFMDAHGITTQVLSISDPGVEFVDGDAAAGLARECNDYAAELVRTHAGRFGALGVLPLADPGTAAAEATRVLDELGLDGIGILSSAGGIYPGDPVYEPLLAELDARAAWVFVHPTIPQQRPALAIPESVSEFPFDTTRAIMSLIFNGVFERHPGIRWHFAHGGGTIPMQRLRIESLGRNARDFGAILGLPEGAALLGEHSVARALAASFYDTALVADTAALEAVRRLAAPGHVLFGSDWPFAARLYEGAGELLQPAIEQCFGAADGAAVRRESALAQLPRART